MLRRNLPWHIIDGHLVKYSKQMAHPEKFLYQASTIIERTYHLLPSDVTLKELEDYIVDVCLELDTRRSTK